MRKLLDDQNRNYVKIYNGLIDSLLFNGYEKLLLVYLLAKSNAETDAIDIATISMKKLSKSTNISIPTIHKNIKKLEEKGVLIKKHNISTEHGNTANSYKILNYSSVWDCETLDELKNKTDKIKMEALTND